MALERKYLMDYKLYSNATCNVKNTYRLLTKCSVKMAGYWPSSFFCVFMERDEVEVHKLAKKRTRPISSHLDQTNLVNKGFIIWLLGKFCLRDTAGSPERARWLYLARSGSQSQRNLRSGVPYFLSRWEGTPDTIIWLFVCRPLIKISVSANVGGKLSRSLACYRQIESKSTNHSY